MFSNENLCPSCCQFLGKLTVKFKTLGDFIFQPNDIFSDSHQQQQPDPLSRKCSGCDNFFSMDISQKHSSDNNAINSLTSTIKIENLNSTHLECDAIGREPMVSIVSQAESNERMDSEMTNSLTSCETVDYEKTENETNSDDTTRISNDLKLNHDSNITYKRPLSDDKWDISNLLKSHGSPFIEKVWNCDEERVNDNRIAQPVSSQKARNQNKKYADSAFPIYCCNTHQKVHPDEIRAEIMNHFIVDDSKSLPFICQIDHECYKSFTNYQNIENHIFKQFFYLICPKCEKHTRNYYGIKRHIQKCNGNSSKSQSSAKCDNERPGTEFHELSPFLEYRAKKRKISHSFCNDDDDGPSKDSNTSPKEKNTDELLIIADSQIDMKPIQLNPNVTSQIRPITLNYQAPCIKNLRGDKAVELKDWTHPIYSVETRQKVEANEIKAKIKSNYIFDGKKGLPFICHIEHVCPRSFYDSWQIENHVFSHFFYIPCPSCGRIFNYLLSIKHHIKMCGEKPSYVLGKQSYRCLYCDYTCKLGKRIEVFNHMNGFKRNGKFTPPSCPRRKMFKPADPVTGSFEKLEPILIEPEIAMNTTHLV